MERQELESGTCSHRFARFRDRSDLLRTRKEHEDMTIQTLVDEPSNRSRNVANQRPVASFSDVFDMLDVHWPSSTRACDRRRVEERLDASGWQRGRHDDDPKITSVMPLQTSHQGECEVSFEMTLVKLVEHDCRDVGQAGIISQPGFEHRDGNARGLSCAGRSVREDIGAGRKRSHDLRQERIDGKRCTCWHVQ